MVSGSWVLLLSDNNRRLQARQGRQMLFVPCAPLRIETRIATKNDLTEQKERGEC